MKEFQDTLDKLDIDSRYEGVETQDVDTDAAALRELAFSSPEIFIELFLHEHLDMEIPEFHKEIWRLLTEQDKERVLLAIPRDHAKTTLAKLAVVWYYVYTKRRFCVYLSNTSPIAKGACKDIMDFMQSQNFRNLFGVIQITKQSENEALWEFDLMLPNGKIKKCILRGLGQGQQMRGVNRNNQRPDIAVIDDIEDLENTAGPEQQKKLDKWMFSTFLKALAREKKVLWLGNMLTKTSLLARLSRKKIWNPVVFGCLVKNINTGELTPLWPEKWTIPELIEDFCEFRDLGQVDSWMCEMMNMPGFGTNGFSADQIHYLPSLTPEAYQATFITVDPAFGLKAHNDESSIAVHGIPKDGSTPRTVYIMHGKWDEVTLFDRIMECAQAWNAYAWGIESVAAQKVLISLFNVLLANRLMYGQVEMVELTAGKGDPKMGRMRALVSMMAKKQWGIPDSDVDFTMQLLGINTASKDNEDDIVDSVAYGPKMYEQYLGLILTAAAGQVLDSDYGSAYGMEVSSV